MKSAMYLRSALRKIALRAYPEGHRWYVPDNATSYHTYGEIPPDDIDLKNVEELYLNGGTLPAGIDLQNVEYIDWGGGTIEGPPRSWGKLKDICYDDARHISLSVLVDAIRNNVWVERLYLHGGTFPNGLDKLEGFEGVQELWLQGGILPAGIDLKNVKDIYWGGGTMVGPPRSWGRVSQIPSYYYDDISNIPARVLLDAIAHDIKVDLSYTPQFLKRKPSWDALQEEHQE